jgi:cell division protein FtsB
MGLIQELRARAHYVIGPVIGISFVVYFGYHVLHGDRGLIALRHLTQTIESRKIAHASVSKSRMALAQRVRLLYPESLDPDMLEERARVMLNYGYADDIVVMLDRTPETHSALMPETVSYTPISAIRSD